MREQFFLNSDSNEKAFFKQAISGFFLDLFLTFFEYNLFSVRSAHSVEIRECKLKKKARSYGVYSVSDDSEKPICRMYKEHG